MKWLLSVRLALLGGLLLVAAAACTDQTTARAPATAIPPDFADFEPVLTVQLETYTVQPGDFLSDIAERYEITLDELAAHNNIVDAALIDVGQLLEIPGTEVISVDSFSSVAPAEQYQELYPLPQLPPPPPPTTIEQLRDRLATLPWPEREITIAGATIGIFALASLLAWYILARLTYRGRRWATRALPRWGRATFTAWGAAARQPRRAYYLLAPRGLSTWRVSTQAARIVGRASATGWRWTKPLLMRIGRMLRPWVRMGLYMAWHGSRKTDERTHIPKNRQQSAHSPRWLPGRDDDKRTKQEKPNWRSESAAELAAAFEKKQIEVRFRPVSDLNSKTLHAVEARLYWSHPLRGLLSGKDIYPATDQHPELGRALLELLVQQGSEFVGKTLQKRYPSAQLVVPLTRQQIIESEPLAVIDWAISNAQLSLDRLIVSVEESHVLQDPPAAIDFVRNVRAMGLAAQLDGYRQLQPAQLRALEASSVAADFRHVASGQAALQQLTDAIDAAQELRLPITAKHARSELAQTLVAKLGCSFEAVGEPLTERTFIASYVDGPIEGAIEGDPSPPGDPTPPDDPAAEQPATQVA